MTTTMTAKTTSENYENSNHLVLNFYPDGYTIAIKLNEFPVFTSETILETAKISYEETSLLDYIENEELPPLLVEMIDASPKLSRYKIWHNGCLILEIRDKISSSTNHNVSIENNTSTTTPRMGNNSSHNMMTDELATDDNSCLLNFETLLHNETPPESIDVAQLINDIPPSNTNSASSLFILLKPTNLSMLNDVQNLTDSDLWSKQDRLQLESKIVLHSSPSLSLELKDVEQQNENGKTKEGVDIEKSNLWPYKKPVNAYTRLKKKLPNRERSCQPMDQSSDRNRCPSESLPPELILQQFLATKRAKKRLLPGQMPRFHRYSYSRKNNSKY